MKGSRLNPVLALILSVKCLQIDAQFTNYNTYDSNTRRNDSNGNYNNRPFDSTGNYNPYDTRSGSSNENYNPYDTRSGSNGNYNPYDTRPGSSNGNYNPYDTRSGTSNGNYNPYDTRPGSSNGNYNNGNGNYDPYSNNRNFGNLSGSINKLIYILLDGFRYDYVNTQSPDALPGFNRLLQGGTQADFMTVGFPSVSFPSWTTLVTGLWTESHGIVGNYFYDSVNNDTFSLDNLRSTDNLKWWTSEQIGTTAKRAGLRVGAFSWMKCNIPFNGVTLDSCTPYQPQSQPNDNQRFNSDLDRALTSLQEGFDFVMVYNEYPDNVGHAQGPESEAMKQAVREVDKSILYLLDRLDQMQLTDKANIVIVSDHGMTTTGNSSVKRIEMDDYLLSHYVDSIADFGAFSNIKVKPGFVDQVYSRLKSMPGVKVYRHDEIPQDFHYKDSRYVYDILIKADIGTFVMPSRTPQQLPLRQGNDTGMGNHGYDPNEEKMRAIFFAKGPDFKENLRIAPIRSVDVYPLLSRLLQINPLPNNGSIANTVQSLKYPEPRNDTRRRYGYSGASAVQDQALFMMYIVCCVIILPFL